MNRYPWPLAVAAGSLSGPLLPSSLSPTAPRQVFPYSTNASANFQGKDAEGVTNSVGAYASWTTVPEPGCASGYRYLYQLYTGGTYGSGCSTSTTPSQYRNLQLYYQCGVQGLAPSLSFVQESPACNVGGPAACPSAAVRTRQRPLVL
jgi:hypothetical protein